MSLLSVRLFVEDGSSCRCSWTKDWYSARQASVSMPLFQPLFRSPSSKWPSRWSGSWSPPPMINAGKNNSIPVRYWNEQLRWRAQSSWILPEIYELPSELSLQIKNSNLVWSCQHPRTRQKLFIGIWMKRRVICQRILFLVVHNRQRRSLLDLSEKAVGEAGQLTKWVVSIIVRCLKVNKINGNCNRTHVTDIEKATITHNSPWRVKIQPKVKYWSNVEHY